MSLDIKFKLPDGSTYTASFGGEELFSINPNVVTEQANAIQKIISTAEKQKKKLNGLLGGASSAGSIRGDYIDYAYTDEFLESIKEYVDRLDVAITNLKTVRDNLRILASEFYTQLYDLSEWEQYLSSYIIAQGDMRNA